MYSVTIRVYSWGKLLREITKEVTGRELRALRTIHGYHNVVINI